MTKGQAYRLRKSIYNHQLRTSEIYAELADAPQSIQHAFLHTLSNRLTRRYVSMRIMDAMMDLALTRLDELDPVPFEHVHEGCFLHEARGEQSEDDEHDVFKPRLGYISDPEAYPR